MSMKKFSIVIKNLFKHALQYNSKIFWIHATHTRYTVTHTDHTCFTILFYSDLYIIFNIYIYFCMNFELRMQLSKL